MNLARVIGTVVASRKDPRLEGMKLLLLQNTDLTGNPKGTQIVAVDSVGAGVGEIVLYCAGSSARQTEVSKNTPVDAVVMGIVDQVEAGGEIVFRK